jgi:hypothetical protein
MHWRTFRLPVSCGLFLLAFTAAEPDILQADAPRGRSHVGHGHHGHGHFGHGHWGHGHFGHGHHIHSFPGYLWQLPYGYQAYGYPVFPDFGYGYVGYGPIHGYSSTVPPVIQPYPLFDGSNLFDNPVLNHAREENDVRWNMPLAVEPVRDDPPKFLEPSSVEAKLKSIRAQGYGDEWMRRQDFIEAYRRYKQAVDLARDRAEPYFRLALAYTGMGSYASAVREIKLGLRLDPSWPSTGLPLERLLGDENLLAKSAILGSVVAWAREDIRDPDRLFLVGVLMHFEGDARSREVFEAAHRLSGGGPHLAAFLNPVPVKAAGNAQPVPPAGQPNPDDLLPLPPGAPQGDPAPDQAAPQAEPASPGAGAGDLLLPPPPADQARGAREGGGPSLP